MISFSFDSDADWRWRREMGSDNIFNPFSFWHLWFYDARMDGTPKRTALKQHFSLSEYFNFNMSFQRNMWFQLNYDDTTGITYASGECNNSECNPFPFIHFIKGKGELFRYWFIGRPRNTAYSWNVLWVVAAWTSGMRERAEREWQLPLQCCWS